MKLARVIGCSPPPSLAWEFFRVLGAPRETGFDVWVTGYEYGIGRSLGKRLPRRFPARQGFDGPTLTPPTIVNRRRFQHGMQVWSEQPTYTPWASEYGGIGVNIWTAAAESAGLTGPAFFMSSQMPYEVAEEVAPWDTARYLSIFGDEPGDVVGYVSSVALEAGTYRVSMLESDFEAKPGEGKYLVAVTVYRQTDSETFVEVGPIGDVDPDATYAYAPPASMYASPALAWAGYLADSGHLTRDVTIAEGERVAVQYKNVIPWQEATHNGSLNVKFEAV